MIGRRDRSLRSLFIAGDIEQFIPDAHILKRVDRILDLSWLSEAVKECYCADNGRPSIDPEAAVRLMLAGFFQCGLWGQVLFFALSKPIVDNFGDIHDK